MTDKINWEQVPIDEPLIVQTDVDSVMCAHYAGLRDKEGVLTPSFWSDGGTSYTTSKFVVYEHCRPLTEQEKESIKSFRLKQNLPHQLKKELHVY